MRNAGKGDEMKNKQLAESLADALEQIASMPVVDPALGLTIGNVTNAYHEALTLARDAVKFYKRQTKGKK